MSAKKMLSQGPAPLPSRKPVVEATAFIPFRPTLVEPHADAELLVADALRELQQTQRLDAPLAVQFPGQSGLARVIKLPPVERAKMPDIVAYEARQQIPFSLLDVEWRAQALLFDNEVEEEEGFAIEREWLLSAVKRDQLERVLAPYRRILVTPDLVQHQPLGLVNFLWNTVIEKRNFNRFIVALDCGARTTTLVITNGETLWMRDIPIGGYHFSQALSRELKLTFAKAEDLKVNAIKADDPKAVFQAMRSVFSDLLAEIQRSLGYYKALNREANLRDIVFLGNTFQLPGLKRYVLQNIDLSELTIEPESFLQGEALSDPVFQTNFAGFVPAIELALERLGFGRYLVNFAPPAAPTRLEAFAKRFGFGRKPEPVLPLSRLLEATNQAWGIDIGNTGLKAVRVSIQ